ncbi:hypothetical protein RSO68_03705 [Halomonas saccharevitans]|uniref:Uncharacterized protein n=2 Tax=Halomonas saccharevitans TaxID=416872 RepID=A0A1I7B9D3_9GAMM|nr:hypothetical protein [Halomonas saccharevitans]MDT8878572.1 hypothetical protein [Halomonas saccharevitans]SFT83731.1 hypothetical protein SAMN04487956_12412 [Halomonas saccharevitans]
MLMSDSMPLLWLVYVVLSLVVLLTGYLGLGFLPRLPRLVITWAVAGVMWTPSHFRLPLLEEGEFYSGFAPAVMVAAVAFLENNRETFLPVALLVVVGAGVGALLGLLLWWRGRHRRTHEHDDVVDNDETPAAADRRGSGERHEPVIG